MSKRLPAPKSLFPENDESRAVWQTDPIEARIARATAHDDAINTAAVTHNRRQAKLDRAITGRTFRDPRVEHKSNGDYMHNQNLQFANDKQIKNEREREMAFGNPQAVEENDVLRYFLEHIEDARMMESKGFPLWQQNQKERNNHPKIITRTLLDHILRDERLTVLQKRSAKQRKQKAARKAAKARAGRKKGAKIGAMRR